MCVGGCEYMRGSGVFVSVFNGEGKVRGVRVLLRVWLLWFWLRV